MTLSGHEMAVWAVAILPEVGSINWLLMLYMLIDAVLVLV